MKEKVNAIIEILKQRYPDALCALHYGKDYELMIAVRLSAQCTDARVNLVTPALFAAGLRDLGIDPALQPPGDPQNIPCMELRTLEGSSAP